MPEVQGGSTHFGNSMFGTNVSKVNQTIQTHNAISIAANAAVPVSSWVDTSGFDQIAVTLLNDVGNQGSYANIQWSNDGSTLHGDETIIATANSQQKQGILPTKARWARVKVGNMDATNPHTMSSWVYLKS